MKMQPYILGTTIVTHIIILSFLVLPWLCGGLYYD